MYTVHTQVLCIFPVRQVLSAQLLWRNESAQIMALQHQLSARMTCSNQNKLKMKNFNTFVYSCTINKQSANTILMPKHNYLAQRDVNHCLTLQISWNLTPFSPNVSYTWRIRSKNAKVSWTLQQNHKISQAPSSQSNPAMTASNSCCAPIK